MAEGIDYNIVQLSSSAEQLVENDLMRVTLEANDNGSSAKTVADKVNKDMAWALSVVKGKKDIKVKTMGYNTYPQYKSGTIVGWSANQRLLLESGNQEALTTIVGTLQEKLKVQNMQFAVSTPAKKEVVDTLIEDALNAFKQKAELITKTMGGEQYKLVDVNVGEDGYAPVMRHRAPKMEMAMMSDASAPPAVESGESKITVNVSGTIQIVF